MCCVSEMDDKLSSAAHHCKSAKEFICECAPVLHLLILIFNNAGSVIFCIPFGEVTHLAISYAACRTRIVSCAFSWMLQCRCRYRQNGAFKYRIPGMM